MTDNTSAPVSSVQNVSNASASPKKRKNHQQQKANQHTVHHIQNILK